MRFRQLLPRIVLHNYPEIKRIQFSFRDAKEFLEQESLKYHTEGTEFLCFRIEGRNVYICLKNGRDYIFGEVDEDPTPENMNMKASSLTLDGYVFYITKERVKVNEN